MEWIRSLFRARPPVAASARDISDMDSAASRVADEMASHFYALLCERAVFVARGRYTLGGGANFTTSDDVVSAARQLHACAYQAAVTDDRQSTLWKTWCTWGDAIRGHGRDVAKADMRDALGRSPD